MVAEGGSNTSARYGVVEQESTLAVKLSLLQRLEEDDNHMEIVHSTKKEQTRWCSCYDTQRTCPRDCFGTRGS